jgi:hypothetical protein
VKVYLGIPECKPDESRELSPPPLIDSGPIRTLSTFAVLAASLAGQTPGFTETFESAKIDPSVWDTRVAGTAASYAFVLATHLPETVRAHFFGRACMKVSPGPGTTHNPYFRRGTGLVIIEISRNWHLARLWMPSYQENKSVRGRGRGEITCRTEAAPIYDKWMGI